MTYNEMIQQIQDYFNLRCNYVKGYSAEQKSIASTVCKKAIAKSDFADRLSIKETHGAGYFYDVYFNIIAMDFRIGSFVNSKGTIEPQCIRFSALYADKYGDSEVIMAMLDAVRDYYMSLDDKYVQNGNRLAEEAAENEIKRRENRAKLEECEAMIAAQG